MVKNQKVELGEEKHNMNEEEVIDVSIERDEEEWHSNLEKRCLKWSRACREQQRSHDVAGYGASKKYFFMSIPVPLLSLVSAAVAALWDHEDEIGRAHV